MTLARYLGQSVFVVVLWASTFGLLERTFPRNAAQLPLRAGWRMDLAYLLGQYLLWNPLIVATLGWLRDSLGGPLLSLHLANAQLPFMARAALAIGLGDLCVYSLHRAQHRFEWLWRFHAVHHSPVELDWLAAHREHPLDGLATQLAANLPSLLLGFAVSQISAFAVFRGLWAILIHSNVNLPLGPLAWLVGSPDLHREHHVRGRAARNFGNLCPWVDLLFGTHAASSGGPLGLDERFASSYLGGLTWPWLTAFLRR
jgi:sterol desaturase/sphingolipid hydroxylase (fatty acid hydroxylase superfamily)